MIELHYAQYSPAICGARPPPESGPKLPRAATVTRAACCTAGRVAGAAPATAQFVLLSQFYTERTGCQGGQRGLKDEKKFERRYSVPTSNFMTHTPPPSCANCMPWKQRRQRFGGSNLAPPVAQIVLYVSDLRSQRAVAHEKRGLLFVASW